MTPDKPAIGDIVKLGELVFGDVACYFFPDGSFGPTFVVGERRGTGIFVQYPETSNSHYGCAEILVRYLGGPGRIIKEVLVGHDESSSVTELKVRVTRLRVAAERLHQQLLALISESDGVAGYHLNGDLAPWSELLPGGRFECLDAMNDLYSELAAFPGSDD